MAHVRQAIDERFYRSAQIQERIKEMILRDEIKIDVDGNRWALYRKDASSNKDHFGCLKSSYVHIRVIK